MTDLDQLIAENATIKAEVERMRSCLEELLESIPSQNNDHDWWPDELTRAVDKSKSALAGG